MIENENDAHLIVPVEVAGAGPAGLAVSTLSAQASAGSVGQTPP